MEILIFDLVYSLMYRIFDFWKFGTERSKMSFGLSKIFWIYKRGGFWILLRFCLSVLRNRDFRDTQLNWRERWTENEVRFFVFFWAKGRRNCRWLGVYLSRSDLGRGEEISRDAPDLKLVWRSMKCTKSSLARKDFFDQTSFVRNWFARKSGIFNATRFFFFA